MATLREIYDATHPELNAGTNLTIIADGRSFVVDGRCHYSFDTNTRYVSYYVSDPVDWFPQVRALVNNPEVACVHARGSVHLTMGNPALGIPMQNAHDLRFAGRMYLYVEASLSEDDRGELSQAGRERGLSIELRDLRWLEAYNASTRPLAFLSHDSRDKDDVARPLAIELGRLLCPVWFDEYSLKVGDSLSDSIDRGIREAAKCILILSPSFLANPGWSKAEFKAIINRHIAEGAVILPVWHNVTRDDVYGYSSFLVDIVASNMSKGRETVARDLRLCSQTCAAATLTPEFGPAPSDSAQSVGAADQRPDLGPDREPAGLSAPGPKRWRDPPSQWPWARPSSLKGCTLTPYRPAVALELADLRRGAGWTGGVAREGSSSEMRCAMRSSSLTSVHRVPAARPRIEPTSSARSAAAEAQSQRSHQEWWGCAPVCLEPRADVLGERARGHGDRARPLAPVRRTGSWTR